MAGSTTLYQKLADNNINWNKRTELKNQLLKSCLKTLLYCVLGSFVFITLPAFIAGLKYIPTPYSIMCYHTHINYHLDDIYSLCLRDYTHRSLYL